MTSPGFRWDRSSRAVLADALVWLGPNRCVAEIRPDEIVLTEPPARRDRAGTAALLECGAALATVWTVVRVLGHEPEFTFPDDPDRPGVAVVVRVGGARPPSSSEWARYAAVRKLGTDDGQLRPVSLAVLGALAADGFWPDTAVRIVRPEWAPILSHLGADVSGHSSVLITTPGDRRSHHVLAGAALHSTRLAAAVRGFSSRTLPVRPPRPRDGEKSLLPGVPQAVLLVGLATPKRRNS
ncbi:hypothetical protein AMES_5402 [Amycolatopsis mediterranei S699]|uniref:Uncharacterized protein n=3 Tax=Amycolatopsis mediterranei TaxID=33910 RepID=A0A0H3DAC5_AMYMU|nr:hypothetical protein [Amycolatopsis mediterranei]ADJ47227.1 hypothetical protein AMED_5467 [Amycolatopsis mediterranei U32]AEK44051.1 hypothetical protein RAM_27870 [Amycolatopsis mediterranei S699]AFO78938.1 hypothetical protein AMES_5402 [Amycolatopsis mediterranei S699]AGT86066.1 hypothetical protein B737_5402 [Amycolatopsis mediterranei RB]KDO04811.1 hypothetical protein DV26_42160 [Amycolatopsis mediterranei]